MKPARGVLLGTAVIVPSLDESRVFFDSFYGKPLGTEKPKPGEVDRPLVLDPIEAVYLAEKGALKVYGQEDTEVPIERLKEWAESVLPRFNLLYPVYKALRDMGFVVRPGLKFGSDFTVYRRGPGLEHSLFVVHVFPYSERRDPVELVKAGRLSHSVRKTFVLATVEPDSSPSFLMLKWFKP